MGNHSIGACINFAITCITYCDASRKFSRNGNAVTKTIISHGFIRKTYFAHVIAGLDRCPATSATRTFNSHSGSHRLNRVVIGISSEHCCHTVGANTSLVVSRIIYLHSFRKLTTNINAMVSSVVDKGAVVKSNAGHIIISLLDGQNRHHVGDGLIIITPRKVCSHFICACINLTIPGVAHANTVWQSAGNFNAVRLVIKCHSSILKEHFRHVITGLCACTNNGELGSHGFNYIVVGIAREIHCNRVLTRLDFAISSVTLHSHAFRQGFLINEDTMGLSVIPHSTVVKLHGSHIVISFHNSQRSRHIRNSLILITSNEMSYYRIGPRINLAVAVKSNTYSIRQFARNRDIVTKSVISDREVFNRNATHIISGLCGGIGILPIAAFGFSRCTRGWCRFSARSRLRACICVAIRLCCLIRIPIGIIFRNNNRPVENYVSKFVGDDILARCGSIDFALDNEIFQKLGMSHAIFIADLDSRVRKVLAFGKRHLFIAYQVRGILLVLLARSANAGPRPGISTGVNRLLI